MKRSGTAKAVTNLTCSILSRKDIESSLGSSIQSLISYNTKKWSLLRSDIFKTLEQSDLNRFITEFETFFVKNGQQIDPKRYTGFIIALEGSFNAQEGILFN